MRAPGRAANDIAAEQFAELREGVWLRPDNVKIALPDEVLARVRVLRTYDDVPAELAGQLWDLPGWVSTGRQLLDDMAAAADVPGRFVAAAGMVRHLLTDPVLPHELLPDAWPRRRAARLLCEVRRRAGGTAETDPTSWRRIDVCELTAADRSPP